MFDEDKLINTDLKIELNKEDLNQINIVIIKILHIIQFSNLRKIKKILI